jgi:hypothetical protein
VILPLKSLLETIELSSIALLYSSKRSKELRRLSSDELLISLLILFEPLADYKKQPVI